MTAWIIGEKRVKLMLRKCENCGRYFDNEEEEVLCERCRRKKPSKPLHEQRRVCECGKTFIPFDKSDLSCTDCKRAEFEQMDEQEKNIVYRKVRDFLYDNPLTPKAKISERFGIPLRAIDDWIHHGKIEQIDEIDLRDTPDGYCKYCGVKIHRGKICKPCESRLAERLETQSIAVNRMNKTKTITRK